MIYQIYEIINDIVHVRSGKGRFMNLVLIRAKPNSLLEKNTCEDLFDAKGTLLLKKGIEIHDSIRERLRRREVYVLQYHEDLTLKHVKRFPKDAYIKLAGFLWTIYHEDKLIETGAS